jgi:hypothetical protein
MPQERRTDRESQMAAVEEKEKSNDRAQATRHLLFSVFAVLNRCFPMMLTFLY